jgi:hypothetical protein
MPNIPRIVLAPVDYAPTYSGRFARRLSICFLLTFLDAGAIAAYGTTLYLASANHPTWLAGLALLLAGMVGSLARVWQITLSRRSR